MPENYKLPGYRMLGVHWRGWVSIFGSFCIYLLLGWSYLWSFIGERVISYFHYKGDLTVTES
jgi:hypothetical protein